MILTNPDIMKECYRNVISLGLMPLFTCLACHPLSEVGAPSPVFGMLYLDIKKNDNNSNRI